jgi:uncharacterized protein with GYD domain
VVRHVVMWSLADEAAGGVKQQNAAIIKEGLEALVGKIEGLIGLEVGINALELAGNYDIVLIADFQDEAALERYQGPSRARESSRLHKEGQAGAGCRGLPNVASITDTDTRQISGLSPASSCSPASSAHL